MGCVLLYLQSKGNLRTQRGKCTLCGKRWRFYLYSRGEPEPGTGESGGFTYTRAANRNPVPGRAETKFRIG